MEKSLLVWQKQIKGELKVQNEVEGSEDEIFLETRTKKTEPIIQSWPKCERSLFEYVQTKQEEKFPAIFTNNFTETDLKMFLMQWKMKNGFVLP